jgi:hypothetical protein
MMIHAGITIAGISGDAGKTVVSVQPALVSKRI